MVAAAPNGLENIVPTQVERILADNEFIISKTDTKGKITYGNRPFNDYSGFSENEFLGIQHNIVRHSDMPRAVFKLLWMKCKLTESVAREMPNKR